MRQVLFGPQTSNDARPVVEWKGEVYGAGADDLLVYKPAWISATVHQPVREPRAIVSVAFPKRDFEVLGHAVSKSGKKLSEFIRDAALARARRMR